MWEDADGGHGAPPARSLLDLGCGTGPLLVAAASRYPRLVGVDIAFRWLVIARHRLREAGVEAPLICACAEALPFRDAAFDRVAGESVLETVQDQPRTLAEAYRVLRPGGRLWLSVPNRFSLGPDPHVGLWAGGFLPKRWIDAWVTRQGGIPPRRQMLSARALRRLLRRSGFVRLRTMLPVIPAAQRATLSPLAGRAVDAYHLARRLPVSRHLLYLVGPTFYSTSQRAPSASRSTPVPA
jgi:SAM-dependent methyltransferase